MQTSPKIDLRHRVLRWNAPKVRTLSRALMPRKWRFLINTILDILSIEMRYPICLESNVLQQRMISERIAMIRKKVPMISSNLVDRKQQGMYWSSKVQSMKQRQRHTNDNPSRTSQNRIITKQPIISGPRRTSISITNEMHTAQIAPSVMIYLNCMIRFQKVLRGFCLGATIAIV